MDLLTECRLVRVEKEVDVFTARAQARTVATAMGFGRFDATEIETALSELAWNILRHGGSGEAWVTRRGGTLTLECTDRGPGFAATAGTAAKGLGVGLMGAGRLMDTLRTEDLPGGGARVVATRTLPPDRRPPPVPGPAQASAPGPPRAPGAPRAPRSPRISVAVAAASGEAVCGDDYVAVRSASGLLVAVIDGLGRGERAHEAAVTTGGFLARCDPAAPLPELLQGAHRAAADTRGVVAGLLQIIQGTGRVATVGNVRIAGLHTGQGFPNTPGCLGVNLPAVVPVAFPVPPGARFLLTTDGVPDAAIPRRAAESAETLVRRLVAQASGRDDALALVVEC